MLLSYSTRLLTSYPRLVPWHLPSKLNLIIDLTRTWLWATSSPRVRIFLYYNYCCYCLFIYFFNAFVWQPSRSSFCEELRITVHKCSIRIYVCVYIFFTYSRHRVTGYKTRHFLNSKKKYHRSFWGVFFKEFDRCGKPDIHMLGLFG